VTLTRRQFLGTCALAASAAACSPFGALRRSAALRLVFYADVHARDTPPITDALARAAQAIAAQHADLVIAGGDLVEAGPDVAAAVADPCWAAYHDMLDALARSEVGVHHVLGNHDLVEPGARTGPAGPRAAFLSELGLERSYASFEAAGYHFVLLDSVEVVPEPPGYRGFVGAEQRDWLAADLARIPPSQPVIVATHIPLVRNEPNGVQNGDETPHSVIANAADVLDIFASRRVILVLQAHLHRVEAVRVGATTFLTGGAICGQWWKRSRDGAEPGFMVVTLDRERVDWEYVTYPATVA
jgi:3',5'-cyclic AMP phosphodiesterase CpdA